MGCFESFGLVKQKAVGFGQQGSHLQKQLAFLLRVFGGFKAGESALKVRLQFGKIGLKHKQARFLQGFVRCHTVFRVTGKSVGHALLEGRCGQTG